MSNQGKKLIGIVFVVFIIITVFVLKNKKEQQRVYPKSTSREFVVESKKELSVHDKKIAKNRKRILSERAGSVVKENLAFLKKRKLKWLKKKLPFRSGKIVKTTKDGSFFNISMKVEDVCNFGDLDAIIGDLNVGGHVEILLTVESIVAGDTSFKPIVIKLNRNELGGGFNKGIKIPPITKAMQLGVYLCKDTKNSGRCNDKTVADVNKIIHKHYFKKPYDGGDSIYFFQYLLISPTAVSYIESPLIGDEKYEMSKSYMDEVGIVDSSGNHRLFDRVKQLNRTVKSLPPAVDMKTNSLVIKLPKRNSVRCGKRK